MGTAITIILWLLMGFWGWTVMENKGRNKLVGAALGAFLGLIGIVICYLHSDRSHLPKIDTEVDTEA